MSLENNTDDPLIGAAGFIFQTPVRAKRSKVPKPGASAASARRNKAARRLALARIEGVVSKGTEVMVKISGAAKGRKHLTEHLAYISRNGKLMAERSDGELITGAEGMRDLADQWWEMRGENRQANARDTMNLVLSMPAGTDSAKLHDAVREFAKQQFGGQHDYVMVLHTPETDPSAKKAPHPHVHLTVRTVGFHGQCLDPKKADLQAWREGFAAALRRRGVVAEATPRRARGVVVKGQPQTLRHMGGRSRVNRWKVEQAIKALSGGAADPRPQPWRAATLERQTKIRRSWGVLASALDAEGFSPLAHQVRAFVEAMPSPKVLQQEITLQTANAELLLLRKSQEALLQELPAEQGRTKKR